MECFSLERKSGNGAPRRPRTHDNLPQNVGKTGARPSPRRPQDAPRGPEDSPKTVQCAPKTAHNASKRPTEPLQAPPRRPERPPRPAQLPPDIDFGGFKRRFSMILRLFFERFWKAPKTTCPQNVGPLLAFLSGLWEPPLTFPPPLYFATPLSFAEKGFFEYP